MRQFSPSGRFTSIDIAWRRFSRLLPSTPTERDELAFKGGAAVLFYAILAMFDPGGEPTDDDLGKMDMLHREVEAFTKTFDQRIVALQRPAPPRQ
jgi:hypothetical protein